MTVYNFEDAKHNSFMCAAIYAGIWVICTVFVFYHTSIERKALVDAHSNSRLGIELDSIQPDNNFQMMPEGYTGGLVAVR